MFKLFGSKNLNNLTNRIKNSIESYVNVKDESYILSVNEEDFWGEPHILMIISL